MGVFIVVEGPEGAGKSTLVRWLAARLVTEGLQVMAVRQPGGTPVAEAARKVALKFPHEMAPVAELFLFLAARADLVQRVIRPALEAGEGGGGGPFDLSTLAHPGGGGGLPGPGVRSGEHTAEIPSPAFLLLPPLLLKKKQTRPA